MTKALKQAGHAVTIFDNLTTGHRHAARFGRLVEGDLRDRGALDKPFAGTRFDAVMHFAACCYVGESVQNPAKYFDNNVVGTRTLLEAMQHANIARLVFSSTCAVYGEPERTPIDESHRRKPVNPYGQTKLEAEDLM